MALDSKSPSTVFIFVGASLLLLASQGQGFFFGSWNSNDQSSSSADSSSASGDLDAQAAYGLEPQLVTGGRCSVSCSDARQKFNYVQGNVYEYKYEGDLRTFVTKTEYTGVKVTATAFVEVGQGCDFVLKLADVTLEDFDPMNSRNDQSPSTTYFKRALEANPLSFGFDDGVITSVCPASSDEPWAVNVKRAVLSHLQNSMPTLSTSATVEETDITGVCQTTYEVLPQSISKKKNLNKCTNSYYGKSLLQGVEYSAKTGALPILKGTQECRQDIAYGQSTQLKSSVCTEEFLFKPLENKVSGASTTVTTQLTLINSYRQAHPTDVSGLARVSSSLLFDHTLSDAELSETFSEAQESLRNLQQESSVTPSTPELFSKFAKQLARLDSDKLHRIHSLARTERAKSFVYDALPLLETAAAVRTMKELFSSVDANRQSIWITSFAFIQQPSEQILAEAKNFLELNYRESSLTVSTLVHNFLKLKASNINSPFVTDIFNVFISNLGYECRFRNPEEEQKVLRTLKAIGNAGKSSQVVNSLKACASNSELPMSLRVAAVDAFRRQTCSSENAQILEEILNNQDHDSELRIVAYLQRSKCFDTNFLQYIKNVLDNEQINQVGSFIWTHLTNLAESQSPLKAEIAKLLREVDTFKKFDLDENKFSRNTDWSYYHDKSNVGANLESNLIWSQSSFVPRSLSTNLTVELFGKSINLIEFGTRVQGIESLLEKAFVKRPQDASATVSDGGEMFDSKYQRRPDETSLGLYIRVFGNELVSEQLNSGLDVESIKERFNFLNWLMELAKERQVEFTRSFKIIDSNLFLPTTVGLPLKLSVEGTATVTLQAKGKFDILRLMSSPSSMEIGGHFKPSSAVVITGEMGIDSKLIKQGLKVVSTLYSKVVVDGKVEIKNGNSFSFDWNTPEERTDVFSMESRFFVVHRGRSIEKSDENRNAVSELKCLDDSYVAPLGIKPCFEFSFNNLEGVQERDITSYTPAYFRVYLEKTDTHTGYHLSTSFANSMTDPAVVFHFKLDTPQSRADRRISLDFELHRQAGKVDIQFYSPWKKLSLQSQSDITLMAWKADVVMTVDEVDRYELKGEIINSTDAQKQQYNYKLEMKLPRAPTVTVHGALKKNERRMEFNAILENFVNQPILFNVNYNHNSRVNKYELISGITGPNFQLNLKTSAERKQPGHYSWLAKSTFGYQFGYGPQQTANFVFKINDESSPNLKSFKTEGSAEFSELPHYNVQSFVDLEYSTTTLRSKLEVKQNNVRQVLIAQSGIVDLHSPRQRINGKLQVDVPSKQWDWQAEYDHIHSDSNFNSNTTVTVHGRKEFFVNIGFKNNPRGPLSIEGDLEVGLPKGYSFKASEHIREGMGPSYSFQIDGQFVTPRFSKSGRVEGIYKLAEGSRHEWDVKGQIEGFKPVEIKGHVNPNLQNIQLKGVAVYDGDVYGAEAKYVYKRNNYELYNAEISAEVFYPSAKHSVEVIASRRMMEFSGQVKVLLKENVAFKLSTTVNAETSNPSFMAKVEWPNNFLEISTIGKYETRGWLTTSGDLQGQVALKSSIPGIEELSASFHADYDSSKARSTVAVAWNPSQRVVAELVYEGVNLHVNVSKIDDGSSNQRFSCRTSFENNKFHQFAELLWLQEFVSVTIDSDVTSLPNFDGKMVIKTGYRGYEEITLQAKNLVNGLNVQSSAELAFSRNQKITLTLNSNNAITRNVIAFEGRLALQTFFRNLENQHFTWNHKIDSNSLSSHYEVEMYGERYQLQLDGTHHLQGNQRIVTGDLQLKSPRPGFSNFGISLNYKQAVDAIIGEGKLEGYLDHQKITIHHNLQVLPGEAFIFKLTIDTPFRGYQKLELDMNNRFDGYRYHAANEIDLGNLGKGTVGGSLKFENNGFLDANLEISTSNKHLERASISLKNDLLDNQWTTRVELDYSSGVVFISGETRVVLVGREKKFELDINTTFEELKTFKFASLANGTDKHLKLSAEVEHNRLPGKIGTSFTYDVRDPRKLLLVQYTIHTPYRAVKNFKAELKHHFQRQQNKFTTHGFYELNRERNGLFNQLTLNGPMDFSTSTELTFEHKSVLLVNSVTYDENNHLFTSTLTTPFEKLKKFAVKFGRTGPWKSFSSDVNVEINDDAITLMSTFEIDQNGNVKLTKKIETSYPQIPQASLEFQHTPKSYGYGLIGWNNEGFMDFNGVRYTGYSELSYPADKEIVAKLFVNVPAEYGFDFHHKGDYSDIDTKLNIKFAGESARTSLAFRLPRIDNIHLSFNFSLFEPSNRYYERFAISFDHEGRLNKFATKIACNCLREVANITLGIEYDESEHKAKSELEFTTHLRGLGYNLVTLDYAGPWNNINTEVTAQFGGLSYKSNMQFAFENIRNILLKASVQTPHRGYESMALDFDFKKVSDVLKSNLIITTSVRGYERMASIFEMNTPRPGFVDILQKLELPMGTFSAYYYGSEGVMSLQIITPYAGYERFFIKMTRRMTQESMKNTEFIMFEVETRIKNYEKMILTHNTVVEQQQENVVITTYRKLETSHPSLRYVDEYFYYVVNQRYSNLNFVYVYTMTSSHELYNKFHTSMNISRDPNGFPKFAFALETPYRVLRDVKINLDVQGPRSQFQASCDCYNGVYADNFLLDGSHGYFIVSNEFTKSDGGFDVQRYFIKFQQSSDHENHFDTTLQFSSPIVKLTELLLQLKYRGEISNLESGLTIDYTTDNRPYRISSDLIMSLVSVSDHKILLKFDSPFDTVKQFYLAYGADFTRDEQLSFEVKLNDEKKVDFDYKREVQGDNLLTLTLRSPYQMSSSLDMNGNSNTAVINWDTTRPDSNVRFEFDVKNEEGGHHVDRSFNFTVITTEHTAGFGIGYRLDPTSFRHSLKLQWTEDDLTPDFSYIIQGSSQSSDRYSAVTEGSVVVITRDIKHSVGFTHTATSGREFISTLFSQDHIGNKRIAINSQFKILPTGINHISSFQHPDFPKEIISVIEATFTQTSLSWKHSLRLNDDIFLLEAYLQDANPTAGVERQLSGGVRFSHPASNTDVQLLSTMKVAQVLRAFETKLLYKLSQTNAIKEFSLSSSYDVSRHDFTLKINTPVKSMELQAIGHELDLHNGVIVYDVIITSQDLFNVKSALNLNLPNRDLNLKLFTTPYNYYQVQGHLKGISEASLLLNKFDTLEDNALNVGWSVNDKNFLVIKSFVKPRFWEQWKVSADQDLEGFRGKLRLVSEDFNSMSQELAVDAAYKADRIRQAVEPYGTIMDNWAKTVVRTYQEVTVEFERMYRENVYHIKEIIDGLRAVYNQLNHCFTRSLQVTAAFFKELCSKIKIALDELAAHLGRNLREIGEYFKFLEPHFTRLLVKIDAALKENEAALKALIHEILSLPEVREFLECLKRLPSLTLEDMKERFYATLDSILSNAVVKSTIEYAANKIEEYKTIFSLIYSADRVNDYISGLRALITNNYASVKLTEALEHIFKVSQNRWTVWEPETGNYEYQLFVPPKIREWIDFLLSIEYQDIVGSCCKYFDMLLDELRDMTSFIEEVYSYDVERLLDLTPPFKSTATLTGTQHFRTFDGRMFQFASDCSHLLARDFANKSFSAFVNYDNRLRRGVAVKKSITVFTDGRKFDILPDGRVMVDDVKTELPFHFLNTHIIRVGENEVKLMSERGFELVCDLVHDHCSFTVSGWYHGKVAGLFGSKNFEKADDFVTSDNVKTSDVESFARSWSASNQCGSTNKALITPHVENSRTFETCQSIFNSSTSNFRSCYRHEDPKDFFDMCLNEAPQTEAMGQAMGQASEGVCRISAAYHTVCRKKGAHVRMPRDCVKCGNQESNHHEGEVFRLNVDSSAKTADVVFVIQSGVCNRRVFEKINALTDNIQKAFIDSEDIQFPRYALVSYGGDHVVPKLHTLDGRVFNSFDKIPRANFDPASVPQKHVDGMTAIQFAAKLPFRTGASKTIIFVPCHACNGSAGLVYPEVHRMIMQSDIKFHALLPEPIRVKSSSSQTKSAFIFGFDDEKVYTKRDVNSELEGDNSLRNFIRMPKDFCAAMTHDTKGIVFSSRQWFDTPNQVQKSFVDVFARIVARKAQPTQCQECTCLADNVGAGFTQCVSCVRRNVFSWFNDFLDDDFEDVTEDGETSVAQPGSPVRPVRPDNFTRGPRQQSPRPQGRPNSPRQPRPSRPQRSQG